MYMNGQQSLILRVIEFSGDGSYDGNGSGYPASDRYDGSPAFSDLGRGFRPALYVKL